MSKSSQNKVLEDIQKFVMDVNDTVAAPSKVDYQILGFTDLNEDEIFTLNREIKVLEAKDVDTIEEIEEQIHISRIMSPVAYDESVYYVVGTTGKVSIPVDADRGEHNDTLTYTIETQPENGTVSIKDNVITYIPDENLEGYDYHDAEQTYDEIDDYPSAENYYDDRYDNDIDSNEDNAEEIANYNPTKLFKKLEDNSENFRYKVSNGSKSSTANVQVLARLTAIPEVKHNHIIWFNGTSEKIETNKHLFKGIDAANHTIMKGWGLEDFSYVFMSDIRGVIFDTKSKKIIDSYIESRLKGKKEAIYKAEDLVVGGFSRGAAFFVPYFLNNLEVFLPKLTSQNSENKTKDLIVYLMDPVNGSKDEKDNTAKSLISLGLWDKTDLIEKLKNKGFSIKLIFMSAGFDGRLRNFKIDKSFYNKKHHFDSVFSAKFGLSHSSMSDWTISYDGIKPRQKVLKTLKYGSKKRFGWNRVKNSDKYEDFHQALQKYDPDVDITNKIMFFLSKQNSLSENVEKSINHLHEVTEKYLGKEASSQKRHVYYKSDIMNGLISSTELNNHSRLSIQREGTLEALQAP